VTEHDDELTQVADAFGLGELRAPATFAGRGVSGRVFKMPTEGGVWAAKALFRSAPDDNLEDEVRLQDAARERGVASPRSIRTATGSLVASVGGTLWRLNEWVDFSSDRAELFRPDRLRRVGGIAAAIHGLGLDAPGGVVAWLTSPPSPARWAALRDDVRESSASWAAEFMDLYPEIARLSGLAAGVTMTEPVLSHCDLGPANFGVADDELVVFDWERASPIPPMQELGYVLWHWCLGRGREPFAADIVAGYRELRSVCLGVEMFACTVSSTLNFLQGCVGNAVTEQDPEAQRNVVEMLEDPLTVSGLELLLDAAASG